MGTTLTGTEIKDTYDSLIKVTDNGPISGTAKYLSDGLGNDSVLALSTTAVGVGTTSPYAEMDIFQSTAGFGGWKYGLNLGATDFPALRFLATTANTGNIIAHEAGNLVFLSGTTNGAAGTERVRITSTGNVGIGTSAPATTLAVNGITSVLGGQQLRVYRTDNAIYGSIEYLTGAGGFKFDDANGDGFTFAQGANTRLFINSSGSVGIGTSSPRSKLDVATSATEALFIGNTAETIVAGDLLGAVSFGSRDSSTFSSGGITNIRSYATTTYNTGNVSGDIRFYTSNSLQNTTGAALFGTEVMRIASDGNVGIGTSAPATILEVAQVTPVVRLQASASDAFHGIEFRQGVGTDVEMKQLPQSGEFRISSGRAVAWGGFTSFYTDTVERVRITNNGLTFNGDTAAANALDDYEEGTWTMGVAFGGASVGVTYSDNTGTYTKIGRQVTVNGRVTLTSKGSSSGAATITGLPFTIANNNANYSAVSLFLNNVTFANQFMGLGLINSTTIPIEEITEAGALSAITDADFSNNSQIILSLTYFV
jgi:hypothetical protein